MITVPEATKNIISRSRYLTEAISKGIINNSSLARYIKPEIEEMIKKSASMPSIIAAINRVSSTIKPKYIKSDIFKSSPEMILRSNLTLLSLANSSSLEEKYDSLLKLPNSRHFLSLTKGSFETSMVISDELIKKVFSGRMVKENTILLNLQDSKVFEKKTNGTYALKKA